MSATDQPLVITRFQAWNFMRLTAIEIVPEPGESFISLVGKGRAGKTSALKGIMATLGGKDVVPGQAVRKGEDEGVTVVEMSNGLRARRIYEPDGSSSVVVENIEDGARHPKPQTVLQKLYSSVAFDPINFMRMDPKDQLATLRQMVTIDLDLDQNAKDRTAAYEKRTDVNRDVKTWEGQLAGMQHLPDEVVEVGDPAKLEARIAEAATINGQIEARKVRREQATANLARYDDDLASIKSRIEQLQETLAATQAARDELAAHIEAAEPLPEPIVIEDAQVALRLINETIAKNERVIEKKAIAARVTALQTESTSLTAEIERLDKAKAEAFEKAKMPVEGLSFGEGEVLFNNLPLDQAGGSELLRISAEIAIATAPDLKVMLIHEASVLDAGDYDYLMELARERKFQIWAASLDTTGREGLVIEDGHVAGQETPPPIETGKRRKKAAQEPQEAAEEAKPDADASEDQKPVDDAVAASEALAAKGQQAASDATEQKKTLFERMSEVAKDATPNKPAGPSDPDKPAGAGEETANASPVEDAAAADSAAAVAGEQETAAPAGEGEAARPASPEPEPEPDPAAAPRAGESMFD